MYFFFYQKSFTNIEVPILSGVGYQMGSYFFYHLNYSSDGTIRCGQPNMYMQPFRCQVTGAKSAKPVASAKPPVWCEGNSNACVKGAKQMIYWNQLEGNNIEVDGYDQSGTHKSPTYNMKLGFADGGYRFPSLPYLFSSHVFIRCSE
jgi:hypothetical protein